MKRFAAVMAMILVAALAVTAMAAQEKGPGGPGGSGGPESFGPGHGKGIVKLLEDLGLTSDQKGTIAKILKDNREQSKVLHEAMKKAHEGMREVMEKTPGEESLVRKAAQAMAKAGEELAVNMGKTKAKIDSVLTPEQRTKASEMKAEFKGRFKDRFEKGQKDLDDWIEKNLKS